MPELQHVLATGVSPSAEEHLPAPLTHLLFLPFPLLLLLLSCVSVTFVYIPSKLILQWRPRHNIPNEEWLWLLLRMTTKYGDAELLWLTQPRTKNSFAPCARESRVHCTIKERHNKCIAMHFLTSATNQHLVQLAIFHLSSRRKCLSWTQLWHL